MRHLTPTDIIQLLDREPLFRELAQTADRLQLECYVVGGYVRDLFLERPTNDIDIVVVGSGIAMAEALTKRLGRAAHLSVFKNFGTAQVKYHHQEIEFVGARRESYSHDSRKPIVEDGTLEDDQMRRDFTINALPSASMLRAMANWSILLMACGIWNTACCARPLIRILLSPTTRCV